MNNRISNHKKRRKRRKIVPWKRIASFSMAVLLVMTVIFSGHLSGVLAEEDDFSAGEVQTMETEETSSVVYSEEDVTDASGDLVQFHPDEDVAEEIQVSDAETVSDTEQTDAGETDAEPADTESEVQTADGADDLQSETDSVSKEQTENITMEETPDSSELSMNEGAEKSVENISGSEEEFGDGSEGTVETFSTDTSVSVNVTAAAADGQTLNISVTQGSSETYYTGTKTVVFDYNITSADDSTTGTGQLQTLTVSDCGIMSDDESLEIWHVNTNGTLVQVTENINRTEGQVSFSATEFGEYLAVSNVATVDLAKGDVTFDADYLKGIRQDGKEVTVNFSEDSGKKYRIAQSNNKTAVSNKVSSAKEKNFSTMRTLILDGINTKGNVEVHASVRKILLKFLLRNDNQMKRMYYGTTKEIGSELTVDAYDSSGGLYIPYKMKNMAQARSYILTSETHVDSLWASAGLGAGGGTDKTTGYSYSSICTGLTIAGGTIQVFTKNQYAATAIGGGGNGDAQLSITGGNITAVCSGTGAAIGGGIGWLFRGGNADISITGGTVYAENIRYRTGSGKITTETVDFGGVAIGSGSSMESEGNPANIVISGDSKVTAYARYGNGIGSGNSRNIQAAKATISISGNSTVTTNALGGGTSKSTQGGEADITVSDDATVNCIEYSKITDKYDTDTDNILGAFGIGGGNSADTYNGGSATVTVTGGTLNCADGTIGGGSATGTGNGGNATINVSAGTLNCARGSIGGGSAVSGNGGAASIQVSSSGILNCKGGNIGGGSSDSGSGGNASIDVSGGTLDCSSIGGGNSNTGTPGAVTGTGQAGVKVTGGIVKTGTIGGGTNQTGTIGFATADISGGTIQGQFILANSVENQKCTFSMTGGMIDNKNLGIDKNYKKAQANGGAVYLSDPKGEVNISGGTIQNSDAANGGAVYMTAGSFDLSGTGVIQNCKAANGGAVYMEDGTFSLDKEGKIKFCEATENGGAICQASGNVTVSGGTLSQNTAAANGGGAYLSGGQLTINGGTVSGNIAEDGAGAYVSDGTVRMFGGSFAGNKASKDGGGIYVSSVSQAADVIVRSGSLTSNQAGNDTSEGNGGAIAVVSSAGAKADHVVIGVCEIHTGLDINTRAFAAFDYTDTADNKNHNHASCPVITGNRAVGDGGGIYMSSTAAQLNIYCLLESKNQSDKDSSGNSVMANGGTVTIGDTEANNGTNDPSKARGNIKIDSSMLVSGGKVDIYGNMENPYFADEILVKIQESSGEFEDHRKSISVKKEYKVHYFENFNNVGTYKAKQYDATAKIEAEGNLFVHEGYKIKEWNTSADGTGTPYAIGSVIGSGDDHSAWNPEEPDKELVLYAIWEKITYTVIFNPNAPDKLGYSGKMDDQRFTYGVEQELSPNAFHVKGMRFNGWNTAADNSGTSWNTHYKESKMTKTDGATINLYAQWVTCTHKDGTEHPGVITYTADDENATITESCDCGAHTATVELSALNVYYDEQEHPATVKTSGGLYATVSDISYQYKNTEDGTYGTMPEGETVPKSVGFYKASITADGKTVSVEYVIRSQSEGSSVEAVAVEGQEFSDFNGESSVRVSQDDAFTLQFSARNLNTQFTTVPVLEFSTPLPDGTEIIMQTNDKYYWKQINAGDFDREIQLSSFTEMGTSTTFDYNTIKDYTKQTYRFIVDFSKVKSGYITGSLKCDLRYAYTDKVLTGSTTVDITNAGAFGLSADKDGGVTIQAPQAPPYSRWNNRSLVLKLTPESKNLPGDASLTVISGNGTQQYRPDAEGDFLIPCTWAENQSVSLTLKSDTAGSKGKSYKFNVGLYTGTKNNQDLIAACEDETGTTTADLSLTVSEDTDPSLKITGTQRLVTKEEILDLTVNWNNIDPSSCKVTANIQKKQKTAEGYDYSGDLLQATVTKGKNHFSLGATTGPGSYKLIITVTKDDRTIMTVPYYFIIQ